MNMPVLIYLWVTPLQAVYMSNRGEAPQVLAKGVYVVSNGLMSDPWEKTARLRKRFTQEFLPMLQLPDLATTELNAAAWDILQDERKVAFELLPQTGISLEMETLLSSTLFKVQCTEHVVPIFYVCRRSNLYGWKKHNMVSKKEILCSNS